jgi:hypothetical protein
MLIFPEIGTTLDRTTPPKQSSGTHKAVPLFFGWKFQGNKRLVRAKLRLLLQAGSGNPRLLLGVDSRFRIAALPA